MNNKEAIEFGKSQFEIFGADSKMNEFIQLTIKALEKRPKGKWVTWREAGNDIASDDRHECSHCHDSAQWLIGGFELLSNFCPNCGADMRG